MSTPYFVEMINYIDDNNNTYNTTRHVTCQFQERERGTDRVTKRERDIEIETERGEAGGEREERER